MSYQHIEFKENSDGIHKASGEFELMLEDLGELLDCADELYGLGTYSFDYNNAIYQLTKILRDL